MQMENTTDILNELKELSPALAALEKINVFTVPAGFFDHLSADILMGIENEYGLNKNTVTDAAAVPEGYFESLSGTILNKIKALETEDAATEIRALSPMLYSIQNENVFEVPHGYFENLSDGILDKVKPEAKVVKLSGRSRTFFKYAVAAVFTGVMALGVFKFTQNQPPLLALPDYVTAGLQVQNVDQELASISDAEIITFLEADGIDIKAAIVANSIDENELPSQEDYLLDEQALDKYLNSINVDELKN